jgi:drug/metabolite transporter (DMT)-like permease
MELPSGGDRMRDLLNRIGPTALWVAFFATSVYGHAALKGAVDTNQGMLSAALSFRGISAFASWTLSGILWMFVLEKSSLLDASTISALRYVLITAVAWILFRDPVSLRSAMGVGFVSVGVYLVAR